MNQQTFLASNCKTQDVYFIDTYGDIYRACGAIEDAMLCCRCHYDFDGNFYHGRLVYMSFDRFEEWIDRGDIVQDINGNPAQRIYGKFSTYIAALEEWGANFDFIPDLYQCYICQVPPMKIAQLSQEQVIDKWVIRDLAKIPPIDSL